VETLLGSCPGLRFLATSREVLGAVGEVSWRVPPLSGPDPQHPNTLEELEGYESVRLFVERARYHDLSFALSPHNARTVAEICAWLEGIPLAIELAAARVELFVEEIAQRLDDSLKLLTAGRRTATSRQRTLRGALDWSHELLSAPEKRLFERLSIFAGGWTLEAAEEIGAGDEVERDEVLDLVSRLVDKSLVVTGVAGRATGCWSPSGSTPGRGWKASPLQGPRLRWSLLRRRPSSFVADTPRTFWRSPRWPSRS
jgi:non-specific serine/threonine protein kinase